MKKFTNVFIAKQKYETKLSLSLRYMISILIILSIALGFLQYGITCYKQTLEQKTIFQDIERKIISQYATYRHYATYGFRVMSLASPFSVFFTNSTVLQEVVANIESGHRLNIYKPLKGKTIFEINKYLFSDFAGILLFFGILISLLYGYTAFPNKEYQLFLTSITSWPKLFFSTLLARAIILAVVISVFFAGALLLIILNDLSIGIDQYVLGFFLEMCGVSIFSLALGSVFGTFKSQTLGFISAASSLFLILYIVPFIVSMVVAAKSDNIKPEYQLEIEKLKIMMDFEKRANEKAGILGINQKPADIDRELVMNYYKNDFPKLQKLEEELKTQMKETTDLYYKLSSFFPTTEYLAVTNEISSKGYKTLYEFYNSVKQIKEDFFKEYIEKVYLSPQSAKAEPFLKGDDNVFKSKPALPDYYLLGFFFTLLWIAAMVIVSYYSFKKSLFSLPTKEQNVPEPKDIKIESSNIMSWYVYGDFLNRHLYNFLSNQTREFIKKGYSFKVYLNEKLLNTASKKLNFLYLCHPSALPGYIKVKNFITLVAKLMRTDEAQLKEIMNRFSLDTIWNKNISQLNYIEKGSIILSILFMKPVDVYLIDDIGRGMLYEQCFIFEEKLNDLKNNGAAILFLTTEMFIIKKDQNKQGYFYKSNYWLDYITGRAKGC